MENRRHLRVQRKNAVIACTRKSSADFAEQHRNTDKYRWINIDSFNLKNHPLFRSYPLINDLCRYIRVFYNSTYKLFI